MNANGYHRTDSSRTGLDDSGNYHNNSHPDLREALEAIILLKLPKGISTPIVTVVPVHPVLTARVHSLCLCPSGYKPASNAASQAERQTVAKAIATR